MLEITNVIVHDLAESVIASGYAMTTEPYDYEAELRQFYKHLDRCKKLAKAGGGSGHSNFRTGILVSFDIKYPQYISPELQRYHFIQIVTSQSKMHRLLKMDLNKACNEYVHPEAIILLNTMIDAYNRFLDLPETFEMPLLLPLRNGATRVAHNRQEALYYQWMRIISNCPMGLELTMRVTTNYEQLATIYKQRKNHKLKEDWGAFCKFVERLPYAKELIIC